MIQQRRQNGLVLFTLENEHLRAEVVPALGGKLTSVYNKLLDREFLWSNSSLQLAKLEAGDDYEANFWGGIDELLPNDIPETVDGIHYPDHGELWTTALDAVVDAEQLVLSGTLQKSGLLYQKTIALAADRPEINIRYAIRNVSGHTRHFLWKMHAALRIEPGDRLDTSARNARIVYPGSSRFGLPGELSWPIIQGVDASVVPPKNQTMDFFYLYNITNGEMGMVSQQGKYGFIYRYDRAVFPFQWYFASYGQFRDHYTAVLEPASAMPVRINEAAAAGQCSVLAPGAAINTSVTIYAGKI